MTNAEAVEILEVCVGLLDLAVPGGAVAPILDFVAEKLTQSDKND